MNKQNALMSSSKRVHSPTEALFVVNVLQESREHTLGKSQSYMLMKGGRDGDADEGSPPLSHTHWLSLTN